MGLSRFERKEIIYKGDFSKLYKFIEKETGKILTGQMSMVKTGRISKDDATQLKIELKKIFQLNHPSLLAFIGCSPVDFKKEKKPVIVTEFSPNKSLENIIQIERMNHNIQGWNITKKVNQYIWNCCWNVISSFKLYHSLFFKKIGVFWTQIILLCKQSQEVNELQFAQLQK